MNEALIRAGFTDALRAEVWLFRLCTQHRPPHSPIAMHDRTRQTFPRTTLSERPKQQGTARLLKNKTARGFSAVSKTEFLTGLFWFYAYKTV
jgi:hypothetical protein